jgi:hypothetical protein
MSGSEYEQDQREILLDEKYEDIRALVQAIRDIYAIAGEDDGVAKICNKVLENTSFTNVI